MKKSALRLLAFGMAATAVFAFAGCNKNSSSDTADTTAVATEPMTTEPSKLTDINKLHSYDAENGDLFAGAWNITDGAGSKLESFVYLFNGSGKADLITDTTGYCGTYALDTEAKTFKCQLMFGINGSYTYSKDDDNTIVLTNTESKETTTLTKLASFDIVPIPDENPVIDKDLVGAWAADDGEYYYFDSNGIMYQNQYGTMYVYSKYSAEDGVITSEYRVGANESKDKLEYSVNGDELTLNNFEYKRITADKLI